MDADERTNKECVMRTSLVVLAASVWTAPPAIAQDNADGLYLGAGLGDLSTDLDNVHLETQSCNPALIDDSDRDPICGATVAERINLRAEYEVVEIGQLEDRHPVWLTAAWRFSGGRRCCRARERTSPADRG
jgi:hypothetical protein